MDKKSRNHLTRYLPTALPLKALSPLKPRAPQIYQRYKLPMPAPKDPLWALQTLAGKPSLRRNQSEFTKKLTVYKETELRQLLHTVTQEVQ